MSDDLVKRLRDGLRQYKLMWHDRIEAADRIEELEAKLSESEALLAKAVEDLKAIAHVCVGDNQRCGSKAALEDLTGGKDE